MFERLFTSQVSTNFNDLVNLYIFYVHKKLWDVNLIKKLIKINKKKINIKLIKFAQKIGTNYLKLVY